MSQSPVGFAVIGTGMIAGYHAQAITETPGARLIGFWGRSEAKARAQANREIWYPLERIPLILHRNLRRQSSWRTLGA